MVKFKGMHYFSKKLKKTIDFAVMCYMRKFTKNFHFEQP